MIALWMLYATAVAAVLGVAAAMLERATAGTLRQRRWIWLVALLASGVLPAWPTIARTLQPRPAPERSETVNAQAAPPDVAGGLGNRVAELVARADARALARYDSSLTLAWLAAAVVAIGTFGVASWTLAARRRAWRAATVDGEEVLLSPGVGPAVIGAIRPRIVVPEWSLTLPPEQRSLMLEHERQHIRSRDPLLLHVAALITLIMPWNVVAWWITRRLRVAVELDCDARVLATGRDAREYGTLLLDVCSRRVRGAPLLAPALFERPSSLSRRILAMHPARARFTKVRLTLGIATALAATIVACEMPTPEMLAPDGKDAASARLYGKAASTNVGNADLREIVATHFAEVARGEGGPKILYIVKSADGPVVMTAAQTAEALVRTPAHTPEWEMRAKAEMAAVLRSRESQSRASAVGEEIRMREVSPDRQAVELRTKRLIEAAAVPARAPGGVAAIPAGIGSLRPDDIATIDVSKYAAGKLAPQPVSIILIVLKPDAVVPTQR